MTIIYDTSRGILRSSLHFRYTVLPLVVLRKDFFLLLSLNVLVTYSRQAGYFNADDYHVELALHLTEITGGLMTFFVVFYNGNVFSRYTKLYELTRGMCENSLYVVSMLDKEIRDKSAVRRMARYLLASVLIFFLKAEHKAGQRVTCDPHTHALSEKRWRQIMALGLVNQEERDMLESHTHDCGEYSIETFLLLHWSLKLYRKHTQRVPELDKTYIAVSRNMEDIVNIMSLPMPFQYFHVMNLMMMLNLNLWAYSLGLDESRFANLIFFFAQLMFQGLRELSVALSDPYGDDATDFPTMEWMTDLYTRVNCIVEDTWAPGPSKRLRPLQAVTPGSVIVDSILDRRARMASAAHETKAHDGCGDYHRVSTAGVDSESDDNDYGTIHVKIKRIKEGIEVSVISAKGLKDKDDGLLEGTSDAYVVCEVVGKPHLHFQTQVISNTLQPKWNHVEKIYGVQDSDKLLFSVMDKDVGGFDALGKVRVPLTEAWDLEYEERLELTKDGARRDMYEVEEEEDEAEDDGDDD